MADRGRPAVRHLQTARHHFRSDPDDGAGGDRRHRRRDGSHVVRAGRHRQRETGGSLQDRAACRRRLLPGIARRHGRVAEAARVPAVVDCIGEERCRETNGLARDYWMPARPGFGKELKLSAADSLIVTLLVAVTNFIWNPVGAALSDRIGRKPVLLTIACLSLVTAYPALNWLVTAPSFGKLLAVQMMFSFYFGVYSGTMLGALVEVVPKHVRTTCFSMAFALAAGLFGTFTPFAATWLIDHTGDKASPGFWLMCAAALGIFAALTIYRGGKTIAAEEEALPA